jgi:type IV pilus assembly protein PilY1
MGAAGAASAQLGSSTTRPACCQLTTSLIQGWRLGPVALSPEADDALRLLGGSWGDNPMTPWSIDGTQARERWVVALNGGYDTFQVRGRGMALVDLTSGHTVWSFFLGDGQGRSEHLNYPVPAGLALADLTPPRSG